MFRKLVLIISISVFSFCLYSQNPADNEEFEKRKIFLLSEYPEDISLSGINEKLFSELMTSATNLERYEILNKQGDDINSIEELLDNQVLQLDEIIVFKLIDYIQEEVISEEKDLSDDGNVSDIILGSIIESLIDSGSENENVEISYMTYLRAELKTIDPVTGRLRKSFVVDLSQSAETPYESENNVLLSFRTKIQLLLKKIFILECRLIDIRNGKYFLNLGQNAGLERSMIFKIVEPDFSTISEGKEYFLPGDSAGFIAVKDIAEETSSASGLRSWKKMKKNYIAIEHPEHIWAMSYDYQQSSENEIYLAGIDFHLMPLSVIDFGIGIKYLLAEDSYDELDSGCVLNVFSSLRILKFWILDLNIKTGLDFNYLVKEDDGDNYVSSLSLSPFIGSFLDIMITRNSDLTFEVQYKVFGESDSWSYTEEDETNSATWINESPEVDLSGLYFSVSYKYYFF